jgi:hypothetical protein
MIIVSLSGEKRFNAIFFPVDTPTRTAEQNLQIGKLILKLPEIGIIWSNQLTYEGGISLQNYFAQLAP